MKNMDEIAYWVHTKRPPCLYGYDKTINKTNDQAHCSKNWPKVTAVKGGAPSPKKKNKRKLVLVDDDSYSTEKEHSGKFFTSDDQQKQPILNGKPARSTSVGSDIDFNIKNSSVPVKPKRIRLQKNSKLSYVKKNNVVTSTPKVTALRRSLRRTQKNVNNNTQLDSSFEILNNTYTIGHMQSPPNTTEIQSGNKPAESGKLHVAQNIASLNNINERSRNEMPLNEQFEDMSDVSGFTANYIRSTKINSANKTPRNVRNKISKDYIKESQQSLHKDDAKTILCMNKSVNAGVLPDSTVLNCSTDSSQNVINLVTIKSCDKPIKVDKSTSLLKFLDPKYPDNKANINNEVKQSDINVSCQSNGTSRYPKRTKNVAATPFKTDNTRNIPDGQRRSCKTEQKNSDLKENPEEELVSRTRSGRKIGLQVQPPENSVLVLSNSTDQVSSVGAFNVANPTENLGHSAKRRRSGRYAESKKIADKSRQSLRRDKSGFTECFSESDNDSEQLKQKKFFC